MRFRSFGAVAAAAALLAACDYGDTRDTAYVGDTSAQLHGYVHTDAAETVAWWFEYGPTPELGSSTPERPFTSTGTVLGGPVAVTVTGLAEGTSYHYRHCVRGSGGGVNCGARQTLTTTSGRDSVLGQGVSQAIPELGYYVGADLDVSSEPDGTDPAGHASRSPGVHYFRIADEGPPACLRVDGDRAAVGFTADYSMYDPSLPPAHILLHIEDNGPTGDRFVVDVLSEAPTTCPDPDVVLDAETGQVVTQLEGFVVHDHP